MSIVTAPPAVVASGAREAPEPWAAVPPPFRTAVAVPPVPMSAMNAHGPVGRPALAAELGAGYLAAGLLRSFKVQCFGKASLAAEVVIAVPAKNEAAVVRALLESLGRAMTTSSKRCTIVIFANDCADDTAAIIAGLAPALAGFVVLIEGMLSPPHAHVGLARRLAMDVAAGLGAPDCAILTTDADTVVGPDWIDELTLPLARGFDLVCGSFEIEDPSPEVAGLQRHPFWRMEARYAALQNRVQHACDQVICRQPVGGACPHYIEAGANLGLDARLYRRIGGLPPVTSSEDRALVRAAEWVDARICYCDRAPVRTSGRLDGRAAGGLAATLSRRLVDAAPTVDQRLRPAAGLKDRWSNALCAVAAPASAGAGGRGLSAAARHARMENEWQRSLAEPPLQARLLGRELPRLDRLLRLEIEPVLSHWPGETVR